MSVCYPVIMPICLAILVLSLSSWNEIYENWSTYRQSSLKIETKDYGWRILLFSNSRQRDCRTVCDQESVQDNAMFGLFVLLLFCLKINALFVYCLSVCFAFSCLLYILFLIHYQIYIYVCVCVCVGMVKDTRAVKYISTRYGQQMYLRLSFC